MLEVKNRFRPVYRQLSDDEKQRVDRIKDIASELAQIFELAPGRYTALALTSLEQSVMWAVKEITS